MTDWKDPRSSVTPHFTVGDALRLKAWGRIGTEADGADFGKLLVLCQKMEEVRKVLGCPVNVHCCFRSQAYNEDQGIHPIADVHSMSLACDFDVNAHMGIETAKMKLEPLLESLGIRMERHTASWIHMDLRAPGPSGRYFTA